ncbi:hypothetical protein PC128_g21604 [Phytophthora cactorum]|nr:hypothetical protein PC128_g21604 [Phytophthora cactorum]
MCGPCPLLVASPEVKPRREDAGEVEDVPVALPVVTEAMLGETKATSVSTLDVVEVTSGVGKLRTSLITLLQEGLVYRAHRNSYPERPVGTSYIVGRVCRRAKKGKFASLFQVRWLDSKFQSAAEHFSVGVVQQGIDNYGALMKQSSKPNWQLLVEADESERIEVDSELDEQTAEIYEAFNASELLPTSLAEVEAIQNMRFKPRVEAHVPHDLYQQYDGTSMTRLKPEYRHFFEHSASASFFACLPLYFWRQVLHETNAFAVVNNIKITSPFTLRKLVVFLGILFYMALNQKGEYSNYWVPARGLDIRWEHDVAGWRNDAQSFQITAVLPQI